jgi:hypothetical protein
MRPISNVLTEKTSALHAIYSVMVNLIVQMDQMSTIAEIREELRVIVQ